MSRSARIEAFADALYDLLHARAQSIGILDISIEPNGQHVDGEIMFADGPDLGFSFDTELGECRYCELLPPDGERWLDIVRGDLLVLDLELDQAGDDMRASTALELLQGLLDARRPLLKR